MRRFTSQEPKCREPSPTAWCLGVSALLAFFLMSILGVDTRLRLLHVQVAERPLYLGQVLLGLLFAGPIAHLWVGGTLGKIHADARRTLAEHAAKSGRRLKLDPDLFAWHPALVGIIERMLYVFCWAFEQQAFVGVWLSIKTVAGWERWRRDRYVFNIFLIGNALSVSFGTVGGMLLNTGRPALPIAVGLLAGTTAVWIWVARRAATC